jgi:hypothetical protein
LAPCRTSVHRTEEHPSTRCRASCRALRSGVPAFELWFSSSCGERVSPGPSAPQRQGQSHGGEPSRPHAGGFCSDAAPRCRMVGATSRVSSSRPSHRAISLFCRYVCVWSGWSAPQRSGQGRDPLVRRATALAGAELCSSCRRLGELAFEPCLPGWNRGSHSWWQPGPAHPSAWSSCHWRRHRRGVEPPRERVAHLREAADAPLGVQI